ncbi:hypothetical protein M1M11_29655 [Pseudomonas azerbaijanoccidens]|uniref:hypothetical protein n=1 Tax=Pseudomonas azerbaijanoccidentalis TaxID=2842347 RepID=UPI00200A0DBF|nr:hypothetical protein [Pseudomonas azerbaijanoccidentalis]MCK8669046.1 hypothetical protein [Pseudomonas azerbaijanoccidentalis]
MAKYFYSDCVISDVRGNAAGLVSAKIDGREISNIDMKPEIYRYFTGVGAGTKNRVWFSVQSILHKKLVRVRGVENEAGERLVVKEKIGTSFRDLIISPPLFGFLTWFVSFIVLIIPMAIIVGQRDLMFKINVVAGLFGFAAGVWYFFGALGFIRKSANLDAWSAGDVSKYSKAVKPEFGSGLAALKK